MTKYYTSSFSAADFAALNRSESVFRTVYSALSRFTRETHPAVVRITERLLAKNELVCQHLVGRSV